MEFEQLSQQLRWPYRLNLFAVRDVRSTNMKDRLLACKYFVLLAADALPLNKERVWENTRTIGLQMSWQNIFSSSLYLNNLAFQSFLHKYSEVTVKGKHSFQLSVYYTHHVSWSMQLSEKRLWVTSYVSLHKVMSNVHSVVAKWSMKRFRRWFMKCLSSSVYCTCRRPLASDKASYETPQLKSRHHLVYEDNQGELLPYTKIGVLTSPGGGSMR